MYSWSTLHFEAKRFHVADRRLQSIRFRKPSGQLRRHPLHLLLERFAVVFHIGGTDIASGRQHKTVLFNLFLFGRFAETGNVNVLARVRFAASNMIRSGNTTDVAVDWQRVLVATGQDSQRAGFHRSQLTRVNQQRLGGAIPSLGLQLLSRSVSRDKPQTNGNAGVEKQQSRHSDDAVHQIGFYDVLANFSFAAVVRRQRTDALTNQAMPPS